MTESLEGQDAARRRSSCSTASTTCSPPSAPSPKDLGKLAVFCGVRDFPARVKCATLGWHTLKAALERQPDETVSTE